ncbi:MAG: DoxX family membrane protein [Phycisphaerales bacterium]|nr:MAG: DoxX family membrane protein [Phycisphaerales bacterium]
MSATGGIFRRAHDTGVPLLIARLLFGAVMISFAVPKIAAPLEFLKEIRNYHIMPEEPAILMNMVAVSLPWVEFLGGVALILGVFRRGAATLFTGLMIFFSVALLYRSWGIYAAQDIAFCGIRFDCGCGHGPVFICRKVLENAGLTLLAIYAMISRCTRLTILSLWHWRRETVGVPTS